MLLGSLRKSANVGNLRIKLFLKVRQKVTGLDLSLAIRDTRIKI